jgi:hypothetical protein
MSLMIAADLKRWIQDHQLLCSTDEIGKKEGRGVENATHIFMDGWGHGGMIMRPELEDEFIVQFAGSFGAMQGSTSKNKHYIIERRTRVFKMCMDLDFHRDYELEGKTILEYVSFMQAIMALLYPSQKDKRDVLFTAIVCRTEVKLNKKTDGRPFQTMTGVRVIFPNLFVDQIIALTIRQALLNAVVKKYGDLLEVQNDWENILDHSIYLGNGVRMLGSRKSAPCPECRNKHRLDPNCKICRGKGKIDIGRLYKPWKVLIQGNTSEPSLQKLLSQTYFCFKATSIRCLNAQKLTPGFVIPPSLQGVDVTRHNVKTHQLQPRDKLTMEQKRQRKLDEQKMTQTELQQFRKDNAKNTELDEEDFLEAGDKYFLETAPNVSFNARFEEDEKGERDLQSKMKLVDVDQSQFQIWEGIQGLLRAFLSREQYRNICPRKIQRNVAATVYFVQTKGEGSNFCMNVNRNHNSASNYFMLRKNKGIVQRCHCQCAPKETDKKACREFSSAPETVPPDLHDLLFKDSLLLTQPTTTTKTKNLMAIQAVLFYNIWHKKHTDIKREQATKLEGVAKGKYKDNEDSREPFKKKPRATAAPKKQIISEKIVITSADD